MSFTPGFFSPLLNAGLHRP